MKIFDTSNPRIAATSALAVVTLTQNQQGWADALKVTVLAAAVARLVASIPTGGRINVLNSSLTPNTITCTGVQVGDTLTIQGIVFTAVASGASALQFNQGGTDTATATSLALAINNYFAKGVGAWFQMTDWPVSFQCFVQEPTGLVAVTATVGIEVCPDGAPDSLYFSTHPEILDFSLSATGLAKGVSPAKSSYPFVRANVKALTGAGAVCKVFCNDNPNNA